MGRRLCFFFSLGLADSKLSACGYESHGFFCKLATASEQYIVPYSLLDSLGRESMSLYLSHTVPHKPMEV